MANLNNQETDDTQALTKQVLQAIENQDFTAARALLSDDFKFSGAVSVPIGPDDWLGVHRALWTAMSDKVVPAACSSQTRRNNSCLERQIQNQDWRRYFLL